jgi:hypothetical protein
MMHTDQLEHSRIEDTLFMPLFGSHVSIANGFHQAALDAHARGSDTLQVFT